MRKIFSLLFAVAFFCFTNLINAQNVGIGTNTPHSSARVEVSSSNSGFLPPRLTGLQRDAIVDPAAGLIIFCSNCGEKGEMQYYDGTGWVSMKLGAASNPVLPNVTTTAISNITINAATSGGTVSVTGGTPITARGVVWSTAQNPTVVLTTKTSDGTGTGTFTSSLTGLTPGTLYYVRAYATNAAGTAYGSQVSFTSFASPYAPGTVFCTSNPTAVVDITNTITGRTWMDRNLGAMRVATSATDIEAYGDLYQWGRGGDGHQCRNSLTTNVLSSTDKPSNSNFILPSSLPFDWRSSSNNNLWQGVNGTNNPCPTGYRLPTESELIDEIASWSSANTAGAFSSSLKWSSGGYRADNNGVLTNVGAAGNYWTSTADGQFARNIFFFDAGSGPTTSGRATGSSVRCIKDQTIAALTSLNCAGAVNSGTLTSGTSASGVSSSIPYTGGNGGVYAARTVNSTGVTGLTATLASGTLVNGNGSLIFTITGTPSGSGTASFALSIGGQSCTLNRTVNSAGGTGNTLVNVINNDIELTQLETGVSVAGLAPTLSSAGPYTLLAPTDQVFNRYGINLGTFDAAINDLIIRYHTLNGRYASTDFPVGENVKYFTINQPVDSVFVTKSSTGGIYVNGVSVDNVKKDIPASNGLVHKTLDLLFPPSRSVAQELTRPGYDSLNKLVQRAALADPTINSTLESTVLTLMAPSNTAFSQFLSASGIGTINNLTTSQALNLLRDHMIIGRKFFINLALNNAAGSPSYGGGLLRIATAPSGTSPTGVLVYYLTTAAVALDDVDYMQRNGVIHKIGGILTK